MDCIKRLKINYFLWVFFVKFLQKIGVTLKLVLVTGCFNVLHPGHLRLLRFAKECGDRLIVGVESDRYSGDSAHVPQSQSGAE